MDSILMRRMITPINQYELVADSGGRGRFFLFFFRKLCRVFCLFLFFVFFSRKPQRMAMVDGVCHGGRDPLEDCTMTNSFNRKRDCFVSFSIRMLSVSSWRIQALADI